MKKAVQSRNVQEFIKNISSSNDLNSFFYLYFSLFQEFHVVALNKKEFHVVMLTSCTLKHYASVFRFTLQLSSKPINYSLWVKMFKFYLCDVQIQWLRIHNIPSNLMLLRIKFSMASRTRCRTQVCSNIFFIWRSAQFVHFHPNLFLIALYFQQIMMEAPASSDLRCLSFIGHFEPCNQSITISNFVLASWTCFWNIAGWMVRHH
jgi:hypothetical protein